MGKSIYINLPTKDVAAAGDFYAKVGFTLNKDFSNEQNAVVAVDDNISLMLVEEGFFKENLKREIADTAKVSEVGLAIQVADRTEVDKLYEAAIAAGGKQAGETIEEEEIGMYSRGFTDLDGHRLDILCMAS